METNDINNQREKARQAMMKNNPSLNRSDFKKPENTITGGGGLDQKRAEARKAMESEVHKKQREKLEASLNAQKKYEQDVNDIKRKRELLAKEQAKKLNRQTEAKRLEEIKRIDTARKKLLESELQIKDLKEKEGELSPLKTPPLDQIKNLTSTTDFSSQKKINNQSNKISGVKILVITFILILIASSIGLLYLVSQKIVTVQTGIEVENIPALLPVTSNIEIIIDNKTANEISNEIKSNLRPSITGTTLTQIYFSTTKTEDGTEIKQRLDTIDFLTALNLDLPPTFIHFLQPSFMVATLSTTSTKPNLIYLLTTRSFEHTYDNLLKNENDILSILYKNILPPETINHIKRTDFTDKVISNTDTRGVYTPTGELVILYAFLNQELLVIAQSETSFNAILNAYRKN